MDTSAATTEAESIESFDAEGRLTQRYCMLAGALHGDFDVFSATGVKLTSTTYVHGVLEGALTVRDAQGRLVQVANYLNGAQHGLTRVYLLGKLNMEQCFERGILHGPCVMYSEAGDIAAKQLYVHGLLEGEAVYLSEGRIVRKVAYRGGLQNGEAVDYSRDGVPVQKAVYKDNLLEGNLTRFWPDGKVLEIQTYKAGKPVSAIRSFDQNGDEMLSASAKPGIMQRLEQLVKG